MEMKYTKFKKLLSGFGINMQKHQRGTDDQILKVYDLETGKNLNTYKFQYDKAPFNGNRKVIEYSDRKTEAKIFDGTDIDLYMENMPYKKYMINAKVKDNIYTFNKFDAFDVFENNKYRKTSIRFLDDGTINAYETIGVIDEFLNFKTTNIHRFIVKNELNRTTIIVKDETDPRLYKNDYSMQLDKYVNDKFYITKENNNIDNGLDIIEDSKYFKTIIKRLCSESYLSYVERVEKEKNFAK